MCLILEQKERFYPRLNQIMIGAKLVQGISTVELTA